MKHPNCLDKFWFIIQLLGGKNVLREIPPQRGHVGMEWEKNTCQGHSHSLPPSTPSPMPLREESPALYFLSVPCTPLSHTSVMGLSLQSLSWLPSPLGCPTALETTQSQWRQEITGIKTLGTAPTTGNFRPQTLSDSQLQLRLPSQPTAPHPPSVRQGQCPLREGTILAVYTWSPHGPGRGPSWGGTTEPV